MMNNDILRLQLALLLQYEFHNALDTSNPRRTTHDTYLTIQLYDPLCTEFMAITRQIEHQLEVDLTIDWVLNHDEA